MRNQPDESTSVIGMNTPFALNWLFFMNGQLAASDFSPPVAERSLEEWSEQEHAQWREWRSRLWSGLSAPLPSSSSSAPPGRDAPHFPSLGDLPELQDRARNAWSAFSTWWKQDGAGLLLAQRVASEPVGAAIESGRSELRAGRTISIDVVGLGAPQDLATSIRSEAGSVTLRALASIGLVDDGDRFGRWLTGLVCEANAAG